MKPNQSNYTSEKGENLSLSFLEYSQVQMIDEALTALGEYGELRLIVE
jgi:hypothetical protein